MIRIRTHHPYKPPIKYIETGSSSMFQNALKKVLDEDECMAVSVYTPGVLFFQVKVVNWGPGTLLLQALECFSLNILGLPDSEMRCRYPHDKNTSSL